MSTPDDRARRAIVEELDRTLFVEAGAGTGKTTALVSRIIRLVLDGVSLTNIAAITFTEKAAAELRERLRQELLKEARRTAGADVELLETALLDLDGAAVCTLHSFAQRILREHTIEAGLPPRLELLDEIGGEMAFAESWDRFEEELLADPSAARDVVVGDALGLRMDNLRAAARQMADNWDLAQKHLLARADLPEIPPLEFADLVDRARDVAAEVRDYDPPPDFNTGTPTGKPDTLYLALVELESLAERLADADELEAIALLEEVASGGCPRGNKKNWRRGFDKEALRERLKALREAVAHRLDDMGGGCAWRFLARLADFTEDEAEGRRRQGRLNFHDLLVLARDLVGDPTHGRTVRSALQQRYQCLLIDEFQDTDPIQVELALLIASEVRAVGEAAGDEREVSPAAGSGALPEGPEAGGAAGEGSEVSGAGTGGGLSDSPAMQADPSGASNGDAAAECPGGIPGEDTRGEDPGGDPDLSAAWENVAGGRLFFVGDPKQSLYRFRRADIGLYLGVANQFGPSAHVTLSKNWRSTPEIISWVNTIFERLIKPEPDSQPAYVPLVAGRERSDEDTGTPVTLLGADCGRGAHSLVEASAATLRETEFADVASLIRRAEYEAWPVRTREGTRPLRLSDVCILIPARTVLPPLIDEFERAGLPYRVESSSLVYGTRAETDLLAVLRAIDDPADHLAVVSALRSAAFGFGDDELYRYRRACREEGCRAWDYLSPQPAHPVAEALEWLEELHAERLWAGPGEIVDRVVRDRRLMELAFAETRHRDTWRRLRRAVDQARAFSDSTGGTLRAYLQWVDLQRSDGARVVEALVPETDDDAVRIMTVHAAKGLEFPFVVVAGYSGTTAPKRGPRTAQLTFTDAEHGPVICSLGGHAKVGSSEVAKAMEEEHSFHEDFRKLYVACTRARDYLAVSLYRQGRDPKSWKSSALSDEDRRRKMTLAEVLAQTVAETVRPLPPDDERVPHPLIVDNSPEVDKADDGPPWRDEPPEPPLSHYLERANWAAGCPAELLPPVGVSGAAEGSASAGIGPGAVAPESAPVGASDAVEDSASAPETRSQDEQWPDEREERPGGNGSVPLVAEKQWRTERERLWTRAQRNPIVVASSVAAEALQQSEPEVGTRSVALDAAEPDGAADGAASVAGPGAVPAGEFDAGAAATGRDPGFGGGRPSGEGAGRRAGREGMAIGRGANAVASVGEFGVGAGAALRDPGLDKDGMEEEAPAWRRGRDGSAIGRAVHAVLQTVAFDASDEVIGAGARRFAIAEGVPGSAKDVAQRVKRALASPSVRQAAGRPHWRELYAGADVSEHDGRVRPAERGGGHEFYAGADVGERFLEGFIDLLYEAPDGSFVVLDYKTHGSDERPDLRRHPAYRLQIAAYALMIQEATGRAVSRCVFVFLGPTGSHEVEVDDLPAAIEEVRRALGTAA